MPWSLLSDPIWLEIWAHACKNIVYMHACQLTWLGQFCGQTGLACSQDSIYTLISLIWPNLAEICSYACKHIGCMNASLHAQDEICAQKGRACSPDSIDVLICLIQSNLAEIWACACKLIGCMHASLCAWGEVCAQRGLAWSPDSIDTLISLIHSNFAEI